MIEHWAPWVRPCCCCFRTKYWSLSNNCLSWYAASSLRCEKNCAWVHEEMTGLLYYRWLVRRRRKGDREEFALKVRRQVSLESKSGIRQAWENKVFRCSLPSPEFPLFQLHFTRKKITPSNKETVWLYLLNSLVVLLNEWAWNASFRGNWGERRDC